MPMLGQMQFKCLLSPHIQASGDLILSITSRNFLRVASEQTMLKTLTLLALSISDKQRCPHSYILSTQLVDMYEHTG